MGSTPQPGGQKRGYVTRARLQRPPYDVHASVSDSTPIGSGRLAPEATPSAGLSLILEVHDLPAAVLARLDERFYRAAHPALAAAGRDALVEHFGRAGIEVLQPLNPRDRFDPDFYRATYPAARHLSPTRAYRHWLTLGVTAAYAPNITAIRQAAETARGTMV